MGQQQKIRVMVLYGGRSAEHEVSLRSAAAVISHLNPHSYEVVPVEITKQGGWRLTNAAQLAIQGPQQQQLLSQPYGQAQEVLLRPCPTQHAVPALLPINALSNAAEQFDVIFPVLHGPLGEDGTVQGLFELADVPYVGSGVLASAIGMDKDIAKRLAQAAGLPVVPYLTAKQATWQQQLPHLFERVILELGGYPVFVKPANLGSSVGVYKVKSADELGTALEKSFCYDTKVLIEKAVVAREIELSVLENMCPEGAPEVSLPGEIIPQHEFYSYEAKYLDESGALLKVPAELLPEQVEMAQKLARQVFLALECAGMARVDLFLETSTGKFFLNEVNTIPGFTSISMYPKLWEASGLPYAELLTRLIQLAIQRHRHKAALKRDFIEK